jgi:hypothetical protein
LAFDEEHMTARTATGFLALLLAGTLGPGTTACQTEAADTSTRAASRESAPAPSATPAPVFAGLEPAALRLSDEQLSARDSLRPFAVSQETARDFALRWVVAKGELPATAHVCLALPWLDADGRTVAHLFILTDLTPCASFADLVAEMRRIAADVGPTAGGNGLAERTRLSGRHFFTLAVSAWSFQHPIRDGLKGLPFWLVAFDRLPPAVDAGTIAPVAVYPVGDAGGLVEVVDYRGPAARLLWSHHRAAAVDPSRLTWRFDPVAAFRAWQTAIEIRHAGDPAGEVARRAGQWTRYLGSRQSAVDSRQSTGQSGGSP